MLKRMSDIVLASLAILILSPGFVLLAILVRLKLGSPILFSQSRIGQDGKPFLMRKFRSMTDAQDDSGKLLDDATRMTPFGKWLRSTSLDELPEFWNVLRGDMSIVGPRPLLLEYLPLYTAEQARRHLVRPGITGWAQVNGRNAVSWDQRFALDNWYVDHRSLMLDLRIVVLTAVKLVRREGISAAGEATMPLFTGEPPRK